jgi:DNA repair protein SbcD/Mre11
MPRLRFVHAADLHLDSPFRGIRDLAPQQVAETLYRATFDAYEKIIDLCIQERVDALLVAGDIFDGADRSLRAQLRFVDGLNRLESAGIRSFICHGNHDPLNGWEARLTLPSGCHRFGREVEGAPVFNDEPERALVYGISYPQREVRENLALNFNNIQPGGFTIGLLHANVDSNPNHDSYSPCTMNDLMRPPIDYWALGHVHNHQVLRRDRPAIVYPGNPQGRHPNETGARGVYLVEVTDSGEITLEFKAVDVVRWELLEVDISNLESEQELLDAIGQKVAACGDAAEGRPVVFRLALAGRSALHQSLVRPRAVPDILERINAICTNQDPWFWCERIQLTTALPFDREQILLREDFVGDLSRLCAELPNNAKALAELQQRLGELYHHHQARQYLRDCLPSDAELLKLIAAAEDECLTALIKEDDDQ